MREKVEELIDAILDEADAIDDLLDVVQEEREALKEMDEEILQELMRELHDIFFDVSTLESLRDETAQKLAAELDCEPSASSISEKLEEDERALFNGAADRLTQSVFSLKSEMIILNGLIDQNERYTSMLLSEWRRLEGGDTRPSATDFRG